ncbi:hypothetical protein ABT052_39660 [Streptomyces sp. NPDC002766]
MRIVEGAEQGVNDQFADADPAGRFQQPLWLAATTFCAKAVASPAQ